MKLLLTILCISLHFYSQGDIDSTIIQLRNLPHDTVTVLKYDSYINGIYRISPDSAYKYAQEGLDIAKQINFKLGQAKLFTKLGTIKKRKSDFITAEKYYNKSLKLYEELSDEFGIGTVFNNLALIYKNQSKYLKAIDYFLQSLRIWEKRRNVEYIAITFNNLGLLYYNLENWDKALEYHLGAAKIREEIGDEKRLISSFINIGIIYQEKEEFNKALKFYEKGDSLLVKHPDIYNEILISHNTGLVFEMEKKFSSAYKKYKIALSLSKKINYKIHILLANQGIGNVLIKSGNPNDGLNFLYESLRIAKEIDNIKQEKELTHNIYITYHKELPNTDSAFSYYYKYTQLKDSIFSLEKAKQITEIQEQYESEKKEQQIALLETENEVQQLDLARRKLLSYILYGAITIALGLVTWFWLDNRKKKKKNRLLFHQNQLIDENRVLIAEQRDGLEAANKTKDRMFQIIAHDLRSPLISLDNFAKLIPFWIEEEDYEALHEMSVAIDSSVSRIIALVDSLLSWAMSQQGELPYNPEEIDLYDICDEAVELYLSFEKLKKLNIKNHVKKGSFVFADKNILSTVVRNLINNAVKFTGENGEISVGATQSEDETNIWVKDTGIGIAEDKLKNIFELGNQGDFRQDHGKGLGLFFCKEFVRMNKGEIKVESDKEKGTTFYFTVPTLVNEPAM